VGIETGLPNMGTSTPLIRLNLPSIDLETLAFEEAKPFFYLINEGHLEKYSYQLNVTQAT